MFGGGKGMGGGAGGANVLRTVGRVVARAGVTTGNATTFQEPLSSASSNSTTSPSSPTSASQRHNNSNGNNYLSISSEISAFGSCNTGVPISANSGLPSNYWPPFAASPASASCCDEFEWVSVDGSEGERPHGVLDDFVFGPVPSAGEVQDAVSALQRGFEFDASSSPQLVRDKFSYNAGEEIAYQIPSPTGSMHRVHSAGSESSWREPSLHNTGALQPYCANRVYDAFLLLQTEPSVQKMVFSLSSDEAVWKAVLNNEVVKELRESYYAAEDSNPLSSDEGSDESSDEPNKATDIVKWIFENTKAKVMDVFEKMVKFVNELFKLPPDDKTTAGTPDPFEERLRTSFLLSVLVLLVVVVTRAN